MNNPWYNEVSGQPTPAWVADQRIREQNQRSADFQRQMMVQDARASGVPIVNGEPQWQTFTSPAQQRQQYHPQGFNPMAVLFYGWIGWLIGGIFDALLANRRRRLEETVFAPRRARKKIVREEYIRRHEEWDRVYGDTQRQGLPCPPPPNYQDVVNGK